MSDIKIKELPIKTYSDLLDTDAMLLEDATDTYHISLEQLRMYFAADEKINTAISGVNNTIDSFKTEVNGKVQEAIDSNTAIGTRVTNLYEDHELTKQKVGKLTEDLSETRTNLNSTNTNINEHTTQIEEIVNTLNDPDSGLKKRVETLEQAIDPSFIEQVQTNTTDIAGIKTKLEDVNTELTNTNSRFGDLGTDADGNANTVQKFGEKMYDDLMKYIDYYHHVSTNPPNFDEPYAGDPHVSTFVYPVGTIFETTVAPNEDGTCELINSFPGTWKYLGVSTSINADQEVIANRHTWERIE